MGTGGGLHAAGDRDAAGHPNRTAPGSWQELPPSLVSLSSGLRRQLSRSIEVSEADPEPLQPPSPPGTTAMRAALACLALLLLCGRAAAQEGASGISFDLPAAPTRSGGRAGKLQGRAACRRRCVLRHSWPPRICNFCLRCAVQPACQYAVTPSNEQLYAFSPSFRHCRSGCTHCAPCTGSTAQLPPQPRLAVTLHPPRSTLRPPAAAPPAPCWPPRRSGASHGMWTTACPLRRPCPPAPRAPRPPTSPTGARRGAGGAPGGLYGQGGTSVHTPHLPPRPKHRPLLLTAS